MSIGFWGNQLCERGATVSLYDYACYNETILGNKSYIFYDKNDQRTNNNVLEKFKTRFKDRVFSVDHPCIIGNGYFPKQLEDLFLKYNISHVYIIKAGEKDNRLSKVAKNCIHCVFNATEPHGEIYSSIAPWVNGNNGKYPVVPHMINLPKHDRNMRSKLNIPEKAIVFGGYGGKDCFSLNFVQKVVYNIAKSYPNIYFLFANFNKFCPNLTNIIHLSTIINLNEKVEFINTCDAMLWARRGGETFGIAIGEFSTLNKPVIATKHCGGDLCHVPLLGDKAIWYSNEKNLTEILLNFDPVVESKKDWNAYKEYTPEKVIKIFDTVYLK